MPQSSLNTCCAPRAMTSASLWMETRQACYSTIARRSLAVIDLLISGGAGFRLCREFAASGKVPILAVSALQSAAEALEAGAAAFVQKPIEPLHLLSVVRDLLGTSVLSRPSPATAQRV